MLFDASVETDVKEIFESAQNGYNVVTFDERGRVEYDTTSPSSKIRTLGELFCEYYLCCPDDVMSLGDFLQNEDLDKVMSADDYQKVICGEAYLPLDALEYFRLKLPFYVSNEKMHRLNVAVQLKNESAEMVKFDMNTLLCDTSAMRKKILEERAKRYHEYDVRYRLIHRDEICEKCRQKYKEDPLYRAKVIAASAERYRSLSADMREKMYAQQRERYHTDLAFRERSKQKCARRYAMQKMMMAENPEYAAKIRKERREAKRMQRAKLREKRLSKGD